MYSTLSGAIYHFTKLVVMMAHGVIWRHGVNQQGDVHNSAGGGVIRRHWTTIQILKRSHFYVDILMLVSPFL